MNDEGRAIRDIIATLVVVPPDLELPLPPSDNRRLLYAHGRLVPTKEAKDYLASPEWRLVLEQAKIPEPSATSPILMVYQVTLKDHRRDSGNCLKILKDRIFKQDKHVIGWELPPQYEETPGVKVWFYHLRTEGWGDAEDSRKTL